MSWILQIVSLSLRVLLSLFTHADCLQADALATLHWNGIIHRNLRPSNIYIDHEGAIKVGDFTRSYVDGEGVNGGPLQCGLKYAYRVRGSVEYMAPEMRDQELNIPLIKKHGLGDYDETIAGLKAYGPEVDVWAFGCLVVDILRDSKHYEVSGCRRYIIASTNIDVSAHVFLRGSLHQMGRRHLGRPAPVPYNLAQVPLASRKRVHSRCKRPPARVAFRL